MGARLQADLGTNLTGIKQIAPISNSTTGLVDCGNWTETPGANWTVPGGSVSGIYVAKLTRSAGGGGGSSHITFIVRNDASTSPLYFKASDATWQAYNIYGGYSLYIGPGTQNGHAQKISYNRPFLTRSGGGGGGPQEDWFMNSEYPMIRFLEANGFDMSYTTDLDVARNYANNVNLLLNHKVILSVGHDEYWSKEVRNAFEDARAAGKHLAFFSGNESYWKTRWENSVDGSNTPFRTMVCYKEGSLPTPSEKACFAKCDVTTNEWTGLWRDGCGYPGVTDACKPENALTGEISWDGTSGAMLVPDTYKNLRFWRNTPVATLPNGATATMTNNTLGYEFDWEQYEDSYPAGRVTMSSTLLDGHIHKLSLYKDQVSKALVFGAGTVQWSWGLDAVHDRGSDPANLSMQQATINLLADMGVQPATIRSPLTIATQSTDNTPPASIITAPVNGSFVPANTSNTISGTASDVGGIVAGVEISVDGGVTWAPATGTTNWTFVWTPTVPGPVTIKSRAFDDIGNLELPGGSDGSANTINVDVVTGIPPTNCPCTIFNPALPSPVGSPDPSNQNFNDSVPGFPNVQALTVGVVFRAAFDGTISAIRFFKPSKDIATHTETVQLWNLGGGLIGSGTVSDTVTSGHWVEIPLTTPAHISAGTAYVASYYSPLGFYSATGFGFQDSIVNGPLTGVQNFDPEGDGPNGLYVYNNAQTTPPSYPINTFQAANYWVDVKYTPDPLGPDNTPTLISFTSPADGATGFSVDGIVSVTFNEKINPVTVTGSTVFLKDNTNSLIPATVTYSSTTRSATLVPSSQLSFLTTYTVTVKGGTTGTRIKDLAGNALAQDSVWTFTTSEPPAPPPDEGAGGPILLISSALNPFSRYMVEILRAEGFTSFKAMDITEVESDWTILNNYDVIVLGQMTVSSTDVTNLTSWVTAGGTLIAQRPSALLRPLMGVTFTNGVTHDQYLKVLTTAGLPGAGIVNQSIQFHSQMDQYSMNAGTSALAMLWQNATTATIFPAVTTRSVGPNGGKAVMFAYDLARSVVYTRQGDPTQDGVRNDGQSGPIRSDNLFMSPNWLDFNKVQIPQADEQQHLLSNIILLNNLHKKPLPRLWFLPSGFKAAVVMTGDDHAFNNYPGSTGTAGRFNEYITMSGLNNDAQSVADWKAIRGTSYVYDYISIPRDSVDYYQGLGFEIGLHPTTNCVDFTLGSLNANMSGQLAYLEAQLPTVLAPVTSRTHCLPWSDWSSQPKVESSLGIRFDVNYYYWPGAWVQNKPGMFTGSGMPMRFADKFGSIIDCYQSPTVITDESQQDIALHINTLLDNAVGPNGYYGVFSMNMHTDTAIHTGSDAIIAAAVSRQVPVVSAKQMLTWVDNRNGTVFSNMNWDNTAKKLSFHLSTTANNLQAMVPFNSFDGTLLSITQNNQPLTFTQQTIKGIQYAFFQANTNDYVAIYSNSAPLPITLVAFTVTKQGDNAQLNWSTSMEINNSGFEIQRSTDESNWVPLGFVPGAGNSESEKDYQYLDQNLSAGTYYYRLRQVDYDGHSSFSKIIPVTFSGDMVLELKQNRPNPFTNNTTIDIVIPKAGKVQLVLYDQMGRPIQQLMDDFKTPGNYSIQVNRNGLSSGIYYYRMNALGQSIVKKMTIF